MDLHIDYINMIHMGVCALNVTKMRGMQGDGGNHHENPGYKRILCTGYFTTHHTADTTPYLADKNTYTRSSNSTQTCLTLDFPNLLISSILFPSSSHSLFLALNSAIIIEYKV
jgi:hypothetical protein